MRAMDEESRMERMMEIMTVTVRQATAPDEEVLAQVDIPGSAYIYFHPGKCTITESMTSTDHGQVVVDMCARGVHGVEVVGGASMIELDGEILWRKEDR